MTYYVCCFLLYFPIFLQTCSSSPNRNDEKESLASEIRRSSEDKYTLTANNKNAKSMPQSCLELTTQTLVMHHSHENVMFSHNILAICPYLA